MSKELVVLLSPVLCALAIWLLFFALLGLPRPFYVVEGRSMEPTLKDGDLVVVRKARAEDVEVGDIIVFRQPGAASKIIIHRVIAKLEVKGRVLLRTKGDNNEKPDPWLVFYWALNRLPETSRFEKFSYVWLIVSELKRSRAMSRLGRRNYMPILVFKKGKPKVHRAIGDFLPAFDYPEIEFRSTKSRFFKPTILNGAILTLFTKRGDLVLDPFTGMGSIPYACERCHRRWIAFEIDPDTFHRAANFIKTGVVL